MTTTSVAVEIPQSLYHRLEQAAARLHKPVGNLVIETLQAALLAVDDVPNHIQVEIAALESLDDLALRDVAASEMNLKEQQALEQMLDLQGMRRLTDEEASRLAELQTEYGRVLLRKARAFALLDERGQPLSVE
jgi:hypothetical protein